MATLPTNPQRVALATDRDGKNPVFITREWLRSLTGTTEDAGGGSGEAGVTPAQFAALQAQVTALAARVTVLEDEVEGLRIGYQI